MDVEQYLTLDATALAALVAAEEVRAGELLDVARRRLDAVNPVINAVVDALSHLGVKDMERPATPERVWRAIQEARS